MYVYSNLDLIPYILVYLLMVISACLGNSVKTVVFSSLILFIFAGIRYGIGYDYIQYLIKIKSSIEQPYEWAQNSIIYWSRILEFPQLFFILNSFVSVFCISFVGHKLTKSGAIVLLCYFLVPLFYVDGLSIVRNASAYSLIFLSFYFYMEKRFVLCFLICFLATGFHSSSYIFILLYMCLIFMKKTRKINILIYIVAISFMFLDLSEFIYENIKVILPNNLVKNVDYYFIYNQDQGKSIKYVLFLIGFFNLFFFQKLVKKDRNSNVYIYLYNIGLLLWGLFSFDHTLSLRLSTYFLLFFVLLGPTYCDIVFIRMKLNVFFIAFLSMFLASSFFVNINAYIAGISDKISFLPYQTIFDFTVFFNF